MAYESFEAGIDRAIAAGIPTASFALTSPKLFSALLSNGIDQSFYDTQLTPRVYNPKDDYLNGRIFSQPYALRYLHAVKFLKNQPYLNPSQAWDTEKLFNIETNTNFYPISNLENGSTKVEITVPASPTIGQLNDFTFRWREQNVIGGADRKTLETPTISSVELVEMTLGERVSYNAFDRTIEPHYLRILLNTPANGPASGSKRFFHLRINGVDIGTFGSENYTIGSGSTYALRTTFFPYGTLEIQVAMFDLKLNTTFSSMEYEKSDLSASYTFSCVPNFGNRLYQSYGSYGVPSIENYYGAISDMVTENQTITTIATEKDIKIIELSDQTFKHSLLYGDGWGGNAEESPYYTPILLETEMIVGKFKGTIKANRRKIYGTDPNFFRGLLINGIEDIKIELLAPIKYPRQLDKLTSVDIVLPSYPGVIEDIYNMMTRKYFPAVEYQTAYLGEGQPFMDRGSDISIAIQNILKKRYILNKEKTERRMAAAFKADPALIFQYDQRANFSQNELTLIDAAACGSSPEAKEFVFYGAVVASFKMLSSTGKAWETANPGYTAKFNYNLIDMNTNKSIESGKEYTVLVFKANTFSTQTLDPVEGLA
jgi:hypothetical protein